MLPICPKKKDEEKNKVEDETVIAELIQIIHGSYKTKPDIVTEFRNKYIEYLILGTRTKAKHGYTRKYSS